MRNIQLLLKQHVGAPCTPVVRVGEDVRRGSLAAVPAGLGANIFSSVDGVVEEILEDRIVIKPNEVQSADFVKLPKGNMLETVREAGIVGMGGAGFPAAVKFDVKWDNEGYVIINASECEPGLRHNIDQLEREADKIVRGTEYIMEISGAAEGVIAVKKKNRKAVEALDRALEGNERIRRQLLPDFYPAGDERAIVRECLGVELGPDQLPTAAMAIVSNLETAARVAEAIDERKPSFLKNMTVRGRLGGGNCSVLRDIPVGMAAADVIEMAGGTDGQYGEIIMGGTYTGVPCFPEDPVKKTTGALFVTNEFADLKGAKTGILVCASGGNIDRMRDIADKYNGEIVCECFCSNAKLQKNGSRKCERPGICPGQRDNIDKIMESGAEFLLFGNCSTCADEVVKEATMLKLIHQGDHALMAAGEDLVRRMNAPMEISQDIYTED